MHARPRQKPSSQRQEPARSQLSRSRRIGVLFTSLGIALGLFGTAAATEPIPVPDAAVVNQGTPTLTAQVSSGFMYGNEWPAGASVDASVDGTVIGTTTADSSGFVSFFGVTFGAGDTVAMTDGTTTKTLNVSSLDVDLLDPPSDTVAGTASAGETVIVDLDDGTEFCRHEIAVDASATWLVDFSQPDPFGRICDLGYEDRVFASVPDDDGDRTQVYVHYPKIRVDRTNRTISGEGWFEGGLVDITHEGNTVGNDVAIDQSGRFGIGITAPIEVGDTVSVTGGAFTKMVVMADLTAQPYDSNTMTLEGTATPGTMVFATISEQAGFCTTDVVADANGDWIADFSTVTPEVGTCDLGPLAYARAWVVDGDADESSVTPMRPRVTAQRFDGTVYGSNWEPGVLVELIVDGVPAGSGATDSRGFVFISPTVEYSPGDTIELTDGATTKSLVVSAVNADTIDPVIDVVSGTATPGETVIVHLFQQSTSCRHEVVIDESSTWSVDFSQPDLFGRVCDLGYRDGVDVWVMDEDGDRTLLWVRTPTIQVDDTFDTLSGSGWFNGEPVDVERDGVTIRTGVAIDHGFFFISLDTPISPGDIITVTDGTTTKSVTVADLTAEFYDPTTQTVQGSAPPGTLLSVNVSDGQTGSCTVDITADPAGVWTADFSGAVPEYGSCEFGSDASVRAFVADADGDESQVVSSIPTIVAFLDGSVDESRIGGNYWHPDTLVDIEVNGVRVANVPADELSFFETAVPLLETGDEIVATDGTTTKTLVVPELRVTSVDHDADIVYGVGPPSEPVDVYYFELGRACRRSIITATDGRWSADFSVATSTGTACDFGPGAGAQAWNRDPDGDRVAHSLDPSKEPVAGDDDYDTRAGTTLEIEAPGVLTNDTDPNGDPLNVFDHDATSTEGGSVTMSADGSFTYEPRAGFIGTDTFEYTVTDGTWGDTATVTVEVTSTSGGGGSTPPPGGGDGTAPSPTPEVCPEITDPGPFDDLGGMSEEAKAAIDCLYAYGITQGTSAAEFSPTDPVPRWQMALFLVRLAELHGLELPTGDDQMFADIADLSPEAQQAINRLAGLGIAEGVEAFTFDPDSNVPRWQMALFLIRLLDVAGVELDDSPLNSFLDLDGLTSGSQTAINQLAHIGITTGTGPTTFDPFADVPRWQMALFLARTIETLGISSE